MSSFEILKDVTEFTLCLKPLSFMQLKNVPPPLDEYFNTLSPQACIEMLRHRDFSEKREEVGAYDHHIEPTALHVEIRSKEVPNARYKETFELKKIALHFAGINMVFPFKC